MARLTESLVESAVLAWLEEMGYGDARGPAIAADAPPVDVGAHGRAPLRPPLRSPRSFAAGRAPLRPPLRSPRSFAAGRAPLRPPLRSPRSLGSFIAGQTQAGSHPPHSPEARPLHRRSIRLKGYDYTQAGAYFVTIVAHNRTCLFGDILGGDMRLSSAGHAAQEQWLRSSDIREEFELDAFVVMPNHLHGIVVVKSPGAADAPPVHVGAHGRAPLPPRRGVRRPSTSGARPPRPGARPDCLHGL